MSLSTIWHAFLWTPNTLMPAGLWWVDVVRDLIRVLIGVMFILLLVPALVWFERRLLGFMQQRQGPNRVGPQGLLQPIADGIKLLLKEDVLPNSVDRAVYIGAPIIMLIPALVTAGVIPWSPGPIWGAGAPNADIGVLYMLAWGSLAVYGIVLAGWSSNNKYALLGGLRSSAQMISYELGMGISIVTIALMSHATSVTAIVSDQTQHWPLWFESWHIWQFFPMGFVAWLIYTIAMLAETNRAPFDLPEAETELIAGYHIEYTSMKFAMFFMGEYANMVVVSAINATLFLGGYSTGVYQWDNWAPFGIHILCPLALIGKIIAGLYFFIWVRATLPRLRYDMLMEFGWKGVLPISLANLLCVAVSLTFGYLVGLITWVVLFVVSLVMVASLRSTKSFATKTRRNASVRLHGTAQPYVKGSGVLAVAVPTAESGFEEVGTEQAGTKELVK